MEIDEERLNKDVAAQIELEKLERLYDEIVAKEEAAQSNPSVHL